MIYEKPEYGSSNSFEQLKMYTSEIMEPDKGNSNTIQNPHFDNFL